MRKIWVILLTLLCCIIATIIMGVIVLHSGRIQTAAVRLATEELSRGLGTNVRIGGVQYEFPMRITLNDLYIEDQQQDTLLYIKDFYTRFSPLALAQKDLRFPTIDLSTVRANVYRLPNGEYNYMFLVRAFASEDTVSKPFALDVQLKNIHLADVKARYDTFLFDVPEASLALHHFSADSLDAEIQQLAVNIAMQKASHERFTRFSEQFVVSDVRARLKANDTIIILPTLAVSLPNSHVDASGVHTIFPKKDIAQSFGYYFRENAARIRMGLHVNKARICPRDLKFFMKDFSGVKGILSFSADLQGTLDSISADNLELFYDQKRIFLGNFTALGLPVLDSLYIHARCQDLSLPTASVQDFMSGMQGKPFRLPVQVRRMGEIHYQGEVRGQLHELALKGAFRTALGVITTDATCLSNRDFTNVNIKGRIGTKRFNLGRMLDNSELGSITMSVTTDWHLQADEAPFGTADARIADVTFRGYRYRDIWLQGRFDNNFVDAALSVNDENIRLAVKGIADFQTEDHSLDFDVALQRLCPGTLHLTERYPDSEVSTYVQLHYAGRDIDHADISASIDSLQLRIGEDTLRMNTLALTSLREQETQTLKVVSDYLTVSAKGEFDYSTLTMSVMKQIARYTPSVFSTRQYKEIISTPTNNQLTFYVYGHQIHQLQEMLQLPVMISNYPVIKGAIDDRKQIWYLQGYVPGVVVGNAIINEVTVRADNHDDKAHVLFSLEVDSTQLLAQTQSYNDSLLLDLNIKALPPSNSYGDLAVHTHFSHYAGRPLVDVHVLPSVVQLGDSVYTFEDSHIAYCAADTSLSIDNFRLIGTSQYILANGTASPRLTDSLQVSLAHINMGYLMPFLLPEKAFSVGGRLTGHANIFGVFSKPLFEAELRLDSALMCEAPMGTAIAKVTLDKETNSILIDADVEKGAHRVAHVDGIAEPAKSHFVIDIFPDSIPIAFINHWTKAFLSDIDGHASGRVTVIGEGKKVWVITKVRAINAGLTIPFTGCRYTFNDSVFMDSMSIRFPDITLYDEEYNPFYFDGVVSHDEYFRNFSIDLRGRCDHTLAIHIPDGPGQFMQGKIYADGDIFLQGPETDLMLTAEAIAVGKSRFRISVDGASSAGDNSFITFYNRNDKPKPAVIDSTKKILPRRKKAAVSDTRSRFRMNMNVDIDPQTLFQLVINDRTGDAIQARGDGSVKFTYDDAADEYRLVGTYTLLAGKMGFTLGNVIRREFTIAEGSQIIWNGTPEEPILNVTANYQVTASLKDLFGTETENLISGRTSVPVITSVNLVGPLSDPAIRFNIELPKSEETIANQVKSVINTDEMMMRQVVYLLVFGKFYTPEYMRSTTNQGVNETYSLLSSTITGQINSWLGKLTNVFTMGFNIRSDGTGSDAAQEYEAVFQLQPVDRLIINGNFGYRYNDVSNRPFFGDLDIEYMLTPNGKVRLKGYTHTVDKYSLKQATMIEGVGLLFKHDFNWKKSEK